MTEFSTSPLPVPEPGAFPSAPLISSPAAPASLATSAKSELLRPAPLVKGDAIGVVTPSYNPREDKLARGVRAMEKAGYQVILDEEIHQFRRFKQKEDEVRAENLMGIWLDPRVKAVICGTGGYGAVRLLPYLDPEIFRRNPKSFVGYSDITALHLWLMKQAGLRTFHGPTIDDLYPGRDDPSLRSLLSSLTTSRPATKIGKDIARPVRQGHAFGRLTGGNLSLVQQTIGTPYEIDTRDAILFLEEADDPMSVADERLLHLRAAGLLKDIRGVVFGSLSLDRSEEDEFEDFLVDLVSDLDIPILMDFPAGHETPNLTLPFGTEVDLVVNETTGFVSYREDALAVPEERPHLSLL